MPRKPRWDNLSERELGQLKVGLLTHIAENPYLSRSEVDDSVYGPAFRRFYQGNLGNAKCDAHDFMLMQGSQHRDNVLNRLVEKGREVYENIIPPEAVNEFKLLRTLSGYPYYPLLFYDNFIMEDIERCAGRALSAYGAKGHKAVEEAFMEETTERAGRYVSRLLRDGEFLKLFYDAIGTLWEREQKVLELRFGLRGGSPHTLEKTGEEFGVERERIRQIEAKALRRLRHSKKSREIENYLENALEELYLSELRQKPDAMPSEALLLKRIDSAEGDAEELRRRTPRLGEMAQKEDIYLPEKSIENLALPTVVYNSLKRRRIRTVDELTGYSEEELLGIDNFRLISLEYVKRALGKLGLLLKDSEPYSFPSEDELYQSPVNLIVSGHVANALRRYDIETIEDLAKNKDRLPSILTKKLLSQAQHAMEFYEIS